MKPDAQGGSAAVWWTVGLTAVAAPAGSVAAALALRQWVTVSSGGGMEDLAAVVVGLWLGAPLAALLVFAVCLFTLLRDVPLRPWWAVGLMAVVAVLEAVLMLVGLRLVGSSGWEEAALAVVALLGTALVGFGAFMAIRLARV